MKLGKVVVLLLVMLNSAYAGSQGDEGGGVFDKALQELIQEKIGDKRINVEVEYSSGNKTNLIRQDEDNRIKSVIIEKLNPETSNFKAKIVYVDDSFDYLTGKYIPYAQVAVAARYIKFGEIIQANDVSDLKVKLNSIKDADFISSDEAVGMQAKKYITVSSIIKKIDIVNPPVIKNNDPVNIVYSSGVINLKTNGIALASGAVGEVIKVKNATSGIVLLGQIINKNTVKVGSDDEE